MLKNKMRKRRSRAHSRVHGIYLLLAVMCGAAALAQTRTTESDREALIALENNWLKSEHDAAVLERILAPDFLHPVFTGDVLTKAQHIQFSSKHLPPPDLKQHFEGFQVRLYGDVGIVNGLVVTTDKDGHERDKTVFTDVFVFREGRWQAVNAQENPVRNITQ